MLFNKYIEKLLGMSPKTKLPDQYTDDQRAEMLRNSLGKDGKDFDTQYSFLSRPFDKGDMLDKGGVPEYFTESQLKDVSDIISGFRLTEDELKTIQYIKSEKGKNSQIQSIDESVEKKVNAMFQLIDQHFLKTDPDFAKYCQDHTTPEDRVVQRRIMQAYRFRAIGTIMNNLVIEQKKLYAIQDALNGIEEVNKSGKSKNEKQKAIEEFKVEIKKNGGAENETKDSVKNKLEKLNMEAREVAHLSKALTSLNRRYADNNLTSDIKVTIEKQVPIERKVSVGNKVLVDNKPPVDNKAPHVKSMKNFKQTASEYLKKNEAYKGEGKKSVIGSNKFKNYAIIKELQENLQNVEERSNKSSIEYLQSLKVCYDLAIKEHKKTGILKNPGPIWKELEKLSLELGAEIAKMKKLEPEQSLIGRLQQQQTLHDKQQQSASGIPQSRQRGNAMLPQQGLHKPPAMPVTVPTSKEHKDNKHGTKKII